MAQVLPARLSFGIALFGPDGAHGAQGDQHGDQDETSHHNLLPAYSHSSSLNATVTFRPL